MDLITHQRIWTGPQKNGPILEKALKNVEMLVGFAVAAQVLNTITVEKKGISAVPTQVSHLHSNSQIVKHLLGYLAPKVYYYYYPSTAK